VTNRGRPQVGWPARIAVAIRASTTWSQSMMVSTVMRCARSRRCGGSAGTRTTLPAPRRRNEGGAESTSALPRAKCGLPCALRRHGSVISAPSSPADTGLSSIAPRHLLVEVEATAEWGAGEALPAGCFRIGFVSPCSAMTKAPLAIRAPRASRRRQACCDPYRAEPTFGRSRAAAVSEPPFRGNQARSKRSRFITLFQAATKSRTNAPCESAHA